MIQDKVYDINKVKFIQVYDVINWLNKNLETHCLVLFDISRKKENLTLKLNQLIAYQTRKSFMEVCRKSAPRTSSKPLLNFGK